jgi:hypothetical protein
VVPSPLVHADFAALAALAVAHQQRPTPPIEVALGQRQRFADAQSGTPQHHDYRPQPHGMGALAGLPHYRDDLFDRRRIGGITQTPIAQRPAPMKTGQRRRRATTTRAIQPTLKAHDSPSIDN